MKMQSKQTEPCDLQGCRVFSCDFINQKPSGVQREQSPPFLIPQTSGCRTDMKAQTKEERRSRFLLFLSRAFIVPHSSEKAWVISNSNFHSLCRSAFFMIYCVYLSFSPSSQTGKVTLPWDKSHIFHMWGKSTLDMPVILQINNFLAQH